MIDHIARFLADVRLDAELAPIADELEKALHATDLEADRNDHVAALWEGMMWIVKQPKSAREKFDVIVRLVSQRGQVHIPSLKAYAGW